MAWTRRLWLKLQTLFRRQRVAQRLDDEMQFHLDEQLAENIAAGMSPEEARHAAVRTFGKFCRRNGFDTEYVRLRRFRTVAAPRSPTRDLTHATSHARSRVQLLYDASLNSPLTATLSDL
jgi:hypothetical protein